MLKLRDFLHLPQLDTLISQLIADKSGMIVLAGINARTLTSQAQDPFTPSGLSAIFNILLQEILLSRPHIQAVVIAEEQSLARVPRQISRKVRLLRVEPPYTYAQQIELAVHQRPGLLVLDRITAETAPAAFGAAQSGLLVLGQLDTVMCGSSVARHLLDLGVIRDQLQSLHWILTNQRMPVLCEHCKRPAETGQEALEQLARRYPHLDPVIDQLHRNPPKRKGVKETALRFYRAGSCEHCHKTGYQGDISVFDIFRNDPSQADFFTQQSLLSLEEYALHLAVDGQLDLDDLLSLENNHLRQTYQMLTTSEKALTESNTALNRKLIELEASNRVLLQRTEVLMSLQDLGQALISSTDLSEVAARVCRRASEMCGADRVVLYLKNPEDDGGFKAKVLAVRGWPDGMVGQSADPKPVFETQNSDRITRFLNPPPGFHIAPVPQNNVTSANPTPATIQMGLCVPLIAQNQQVGAMVVQSTQKNFFKPGETALLQTFANQAALAIQRTRLVDELRAKINQLEAAQVELVKKERMEHELDLARQVQQSMLPSHFPSVPGYEFSAHNEPARQVGGDLYDIFLLDEDHFGIMIADVADKGMPAALYMALTRSLILAEARRALSPRSVLLNVNRLLLELGELNGFVSVFYGVIECSTGRLAYARAGHDRPFLLRNGQAQQLGGEGVVLGALEGGDFNLSEEQILLIPNDRLVMYTDGLTDVANADGKFSGISRLKDYLQSIAPLSAQEICNQVFSDLNAYRGQAEQFDDMTLFVLEVKKK